VRTWMDVVGRDEVLGGVSICQAVIDWLVEAIESRRVACETLSDGASARTCPTGQMLVVDEGFLCT
jgi:hypothetical protein